MEVTKSERELILMTIKRNEKVGRYATASCELNPGDVIFSETPFAFGPKADSPSLCLGCYTAVDGSTLCSSCRWPVCSIKCETVAAHKNAECVIFSKAKVRYQSMENLTIPCMQYECITPLRVLLAKQANPERWDQEVKDMESNNALRKDEPIWNFNQINIVNYLRGPCKLKDCFNEELIHTVCGILESNAFEARTISGHPIRCLFPKLAILSHNCISNITHSINATGLGDSNDFRVSVRAATSVREGEELFSSYTYSMWPTLTRREHLKKSKYFDCYCSRCTDPTEMGTHMSTLKCNKCDDGLVMSMNPLDECATWICSNCENTQTNADVRNLFDNIQEQLDAADNYLGPNRSHLLEMLLEKYERVLHPQQSYCCTLRSALIHTYGRSGGHLTTNCPIPTLEKKVELCKQFLKIIDVVEPGYTRIRGITLYELQAALALLVENAQKKITDNNKLQLLLQEVLAVLEEAATILRFEPESTFEGKVGMLASSSLSALQRHYSHILEGELSIIDVMFGNKHIS